MIHDNKGSEIFNCLKPEQIRIFEHVIKYNYPLKYFTSTVSEDQLLNFDQEISRSSIHNYSMSGDGMNSYNGGKLIQK